MKLYDISLFTFILVNVMIYLTGAGFFGVGSSYSSTAQNTLENLTQVTTENTIQTENQDLLSLSNLPLPQELKDFFGRIFALPQIMKQDYGLDAKLVDLVTIGIAAIWVIGLLQLISNRSMRAYE